MQLLCLAAHVLHGICDVLHGICECAAWHMGAMQICLAAHWPLVMVSRFVCLFFLFPINYFNLYFCKRAFVYARECICVFRFLFILHLLSPLPSLTNLFRL